jgi:hypothetical protein
VRILVDGPPRAESAEAKFIEFMNLHKNIMMQDFAVRLDEAVRSLPGAGEAPDLKSERLKISEAMHTALLSELRAHFRDVLRGKHRVAVLNVGRPAAMPSAGEVDEELLELRRPDVTLQLLHLEYRETPCARSEKFFVSLSPKA